MQDFYPPPLILVEKDRDGVVKMLAAFSKDNVCDNNGLGSHDDGVEGISIRLVDAYRRSADRWIVGNKAKSSGQHRYRYLVTLQHSRILPFLPAINAQ